MVKKPNVVWNKAAEASLRKAYKQIKEDSPINAEKVRDEILAVQENYPITPKFTH